MAILGETGETPLLMKGFRCLINFWHRVRGLPDNSLAKKALLDNVQMRSNWIHLVEKALLLFDIQFTERSTLFKIKTKNRYGQKYKENWEEYMTNYQSPKVAFYKSLKKSCVFEEYLKSI